MQSPEKGEVVLVTQGQPITREMVEKLQAGTNLRFGNRCKVCGGFKEGGICARHVKLESH